jgi:hypothetical protein
MEDNTQAQSGTTPSTQSDAVVENPETIVVNRSAEEYAKRVKELAEENKKYRQAAVEAKQKAEALEKQQLEAQGKWQELAKSEEAARKAAEDRLKQTAGTFGMRLINKAIEAEAAKRGCVDTKALLRLVDIDRIEINDDFEVDESSVVNLLDQAAKDKAYLFQKQVPQPKDLPPSGGSQTIKEKSLKDMSTTEKLAKLAEIMAKKGA